MAQILIRDLDAKVVARLKERARRNGRSLQSEAKMILTEAAAYSMEEALEAADRIRKSFSSEFSDSTELIRKDRIR